MPSQASHPKRDFLLSLYKSAVATAHPGVCVPPHLPTIRDGKQLIVIGAGKAAAAMAQATELHYAQLGQLDRISGFVTTRHGYELPTNHLELLSAGHPVPDDGSIVGARRTLEKVRTLGPNDDVLCLLSGGASALWSAPAGDLTLAEKQTITKDLLRCGATISEINCVRKHLSRIKGGQLAAATQAAKLTTLVISDVPGDDPDAIGSGPTVPDLTTLADARAVLDKYSVTPSDAVKVALSDPSNETLKPGDTITTELDYIFVARPQASLEKAAELVKADGYDVEILGDSLEGEAREVAKMHAEKALAAKKAGRRLALLSGGELTVTLRGDGRGGPNQEFALALALALDAEESICGLAGDTDGTDGGRGAADDPAGALVFPDTLGRAQAQDLNAANFLENNNSTGFFQAINDLILWGPTQTNVNDFRVILIDP